MNRFNSIFAFTVLATCALPTLAADLTAEQVKQILSLSDHESSAALAGKNLSRLDLSQQDFQRANLVRTSFFASKLVWCEVRLGMLYKIMQYPKRGPDSPDSLIT